MEFSVWVVESLSSYTVSSAGAAAVSVEAEPVEAVLLDAGALPQAARARTIAAQRSRETSFFISDPPVFFRFVRSLAMAVL